VKKVLFTDCCGIDINRQSIRVVKMQRSKKNWIIKKHAEYENPSNKSFADDLLQLSQVLNEIKSEFSCKRCISAISGSHVFYRCIQIPVLTMKEINQAISWEAEDFAIMFGEDYVWDYEVIDKFKNSFQILLASVSKKTAIDYVRAFENSGLKLIALDIYPLATARFLSLVDNRNNIGVICLTDDYCEISVLKKGKLIFTRNLIVDNKKLSDPYFTKEFVMEIAQFLNVNFLYNENFKIDRVYLLGNDKENKIFNNTFREIVSYPISEVFSVGNNLRCVSESNQGIDYNKYFRAIGLAMRGR